MSHVWFAMQSDGAGEATQDSGKRKRPYLVMVRDQLEALNSAQLTAERRRTIYVGEVAPRVEFEESRSKRNRRQRELAQLATPLTSRVESRDLQTWTLTPSSLKFKLRFFNLHFSVFVNLI